MRRSKASSRNVGKITFLPNEVVKNRAFHFFMFTEKSLQLNKLLQLTILFTLLDSHDFV